MSTELPNQSLPPRVRSGVTGLDEITHGGWPANYLYLVEGDPGAGKTTIGLQFLLEGAKHDEPVLYVTLSESQLELEGVAESHNWPLDKISIFEFIPSSETLKPENEYSALHPSEVEFQDTMQSILQKIEDVRPTRVVIDSLSEIRLLARESLRYRRQVLALKSYFLTRSCTVLMLDDRTLADRDLQLHSIAHGVLLLERMPRNYGGERRRLRVSKLRGSVYREGYHDYAIETGGIRAFPRLVAKEHKLQQTSGSALSGVRALDKLWGGGVPWGSSTLITGPAGCGKSSIAVRYAVTAAQRGEPSALFHFDESLPSLLERSSNLGMDLRPHIASGMMEVHQLDPAELSPGEFAERVRYAVENRNAKVITIDSLNGLFNAMSEENQMILQMHELCAYLNHRGVATFLLLAQKGVFRSSMTPGLDLSYLADNVLLVRYFEAQGTVKKALSVVKKRSGIHEESIRELRLSRAGIDVGEPLTDFRDVLSSSPLYTGPTSNLQEAKDERPES